MLSFRAAHACLTHPPPLWVEEGFVKKEALGLMVDGKPGEGERAPGQDIKHLAEEMAGWF